jgi:ring-1,2-phenylacetyl-CoA epoxidase subunit PaaD
VAVTGSHATPAALDRARQVAATVPDPELPMLTLADLGVLRAVEFLDDILVVTITPTYTGCPAMATMRADLEVALRRAGFEQVDIRTTLTPAWSSDWISRNGLAALAEHGISPPQPISRVQGPINLVLSSTARVPACSQCGSSATRELSRFGSTACKSLNVCEACGESFDHFKEI